METYVRLMVLKARYRWGYRVLVAEVSDSIHLRRFCRISSGSECRTSRRSASSPSDRAETVTELDPVVDRDRDAGETVPTAGGQDRLDGLEADVRYPTDADLASHGVKVLARRAKLAGW